MNETPVALVPVTKVPVPAPPVDAPAAVAAPTYSGEDFEKVIKRFAESIDSLLLSLPNIMSFMEVMAATRQAEFLSFLKASGAEQVVEGTKIHFTVSGSGATKALRMERRLKTDQTAYRLIDRKSTRLNSSHANIS